MTKQQEDSASQNSCDLLTLNRSMFFLSRGNSHEGFSSGQWLGNAFAIHTHYCLTAKHVVNDEDVTNLYLHGGGLITPQKISVCKMHPTRDVALLEIDPGAPPFQHYFHLATATSPLSTYQSNEETLYSCGYVNLQESVQRFAVTVSQYNGTVSAYGLQGYIQPGRSGGCLLNAMQKITGVVFANNDQQNNHYAVAVDSFRDWLTELLPAPAPNSHLTEAQHTVIQKLQSGLPVEGELLKHLQIAPVTDAITFALKRYALQIQDKKLDALFVNLILLADRGEDNEQGRFQKDAEFTDLLELLQERQEIAIALIGRPGNGKTILLKHLELQLCLQHIVEPSALHPLPFFLELNQYPPKASPDISPLEWLSIEWQKAYPQLPALTDYMQQQPVILLLDALNEMKASADDYEQKIRDWRDLLKQLQANYPGTRVCFSCRTAEYSGVLSDERGLPVPQVRFKDLSNEVVREFLTKHLGESGNKLADDLLAIPGLELKTPFYLALAVRYFKATGSSPVSSSELIASMVWLSLIAEHNKTAPSVLLKELLTLQEYKWIANDGYWKNKAHQIPKKGPLLKGLIQLAWSMQSNSGGEKEISLEYEDIITVFATVCDGNESQAERLKTLAEQLDFLVAVEPEVSWKFSHQLLQEYLAAHKLIEQPNLDLLYKPWQVNEALPDFHKTVSGLGVSDPLPSRKTSGWEETGFHAAALSKTPRQYIESLQQQDLALAARCARHPEVVTRIDSEQKSQLQQSLLCMSRNAKADLRARIEAGLELGRLGDPRFRAIQGVDALYIPPPLVSILSGEYPIGSDNERYDERPAHTVQLASYAIGQYPVTNAEWQCFMEAGGYEDKRWWQTEQAQLWQQGKLENKEQIDWFVTRYIALELDFEGTCQRDHVANSVMEEYRSWFDECPTLAAFKLAVEKLHKPQKYWGSLEWLNPRFNNPLQPVVGICLYEVSAYCLWLSYQSGRNYQLPSEAQWKAAAGGRKRNLFPWGNNPASTSFVNSLANCEELHIRQSTPVGIFQEGAAKHQTGEIYDLAGNVWEWSSSLYQDYPITEHDRRNQLEPTGKRVLNGGAWDFPTQFASVAYRNGCTPSGRRDNFGFRVVCSPTSVPFW